MALLITILGFIAITRMSTDIFPEINIPVASAIFTYTGISADEMEKRISTIAERAFTTTVNDIEHIESQSLNGVSVIKVFFHPNARVEAGVAQITATSQSRASVMPPNMFSPFIVRYNASSIPILQLAVSERRCRSSSSMTTAPTSSATQIGHRAGRLGAASRWRPAAADHGRSRSEGSLRQGSLTERRHQLARRAESDPAGRSAKMATASITSG